MKKTPFLCLIILFVAIRPSGLGISIKVQFRSFNADPTLRFQKFLRGSEKILSMDIDKPGKAKVTAYGRS